MSAPLADVVHVVGIDYLRRTVQLAVPLERLPEALTALGAEGEAR